MKNMFMCKGSKCPIKLTCKRHTGKESKDQEYYNFSPFDGEYCEYYIQALKSGKKEK
jgi:hypothetical protein